MSGAANDFGFSLGSSDKDLISLKIISCQNKIFKSYAQNEGLSIDEAEKKLRNDFEKIKINIRKI